jgi:hypothetical protein
MQILLLMNAELETRKLTVVRLVFPMTLILIYINHKLMFASTVQRCTLFTPHCIRVLKILLGLQLFAGP